MGGTSKLLFLNGIIVAILALYHFPTLYAFLHTPPGMVFTGNAAWFDPWDLNVYVAAIRWGQEGHFLLANRYTTDSLPLSLMYPLYTGIGFFARIINPYLLFTITALIVGYMLALTLYWLGTQFFPQSQIKPYLVLLFTAVGGGFGWINFYIPDNDITSFTYNSAFQRGHEGLGVLCNLIAFYLLYRSITEKPATKRYIGMAIFLLLATFFYPYSVGVFLFVTILSLFFFPQSRVRFHLLSLIAISTAAVGVAGIYYLHLQHTGFASISTQHLSSISVPLILLGYGVYFPFVLYAIYTSFSRNRVVRFCTIWIIVSILFSLLPIGVARFFLRGLYFPMTIVALSAVSKPVFYIILSMLLPLTNLTIFTARIDEITQNNHWYYMLQEEQKGIDYLSKLSISNVVSGYYIGNHIPALTNDSVYYGHLIQTPRATEKEMIIKKFYSGKISTQKAHDFLLANNITYVWYGWEEKEFGNIPSYSFLRRVYSNKEVAIYKVN